MYKLKALIVTIVLGAVGSIIASYIYDGTVWAFIKSTFGFLFFAVLIPLSVLVFALVVVALIFFIIGRRSSSNVVVTDATSETEFAALLPNVAMQDEGVESASEKHRDMYNLAKRVMGLISSYSFYIDDDIVGKCTGAPGEEVREVIAHLLNIDVIHYESGYLRKSTRGDERLRAEFLPSLKY